MYDVIVIGAGISGATFAYKASKFSNAMLIEARSKNDLPVSTNIFAEHNKAFLTEFDYSDKSIFPVIHEKMNYMAAEEDGIVNSDEFGAPLGYVCHTEKLIDKLLNESENQGGTIKFNEKITRIEKHADHVEIINNKGESYSTRLLVLATGSLGFELQRSVGFGTPDRYLGIYTHLRGNQDEINDQMVPNYIFHINPQISTNGPFYLEKGYERIPIGFMGNSKETPKELVSKLERILNNYKRIQPIVKGLKRDPNPVVTYISKHPIKFFSNDRMMVLGEAAGLVTAFFYEGLLCGMCSADLAVKTIKPLLEKDSIFTRNELNSYDRELHRILLKNYFVNGEGSEYLFYSAGAHVKTLWSTYVNLINRDKQLRREIWEAYRMYDLENYTLNGTRRAGRLLFSMLPALTKIALSGKFIKAAFM
ncbi:MAG: NAD(P)/FAD-dependent oxidoreductase [Promethearchaeota archaeon]